MNKNCVYYCEGEDDLQLIESLKVSPSKILPGNRNAEMALNMMAMVAESESRSISQNTQWALKKLAEK